MYGTDYNYAATRLNETVVRHEGELVEVMRVDGDNGTTSVVNVVTGSEQRVPLAELDVSPLSLGYINHQGTATYVVRQPKRRDWRQGTRRGNLTTLRGLGMGNIAYGMLARTVKGEFPSFTKVLKSHLTVKDSIAFHRDWAVARNGDLLYKSVGKVGLVADGEPQLATKYAYLDEALKEAV